ncbi:MAG: Ig-like domain-containing protein [Myxococcales bacterium]|nr:Ig-like domain-containing protein [Myxococcales bacterium]
MQHSLMFRVLAAVTLVVFSSTSCGPTRPARAPRTVVNAAAGAPLAPAVEPTGLTLRLSDGAAARPAPVRSQLAPATALDDAAAQAVLDRVAPIRATPTDAVPFALRAGAPPPRSSTTIAGVFPPPAQPAPPRVGRRAPLTVVRYAPAGDVPTAPQLQVTFSQPMVAVTAQDDAATAVPATLTPTPPGQWRWLGAQTLTFDPGTRFPQATTYTVTIAKGATAASGATLTTSTRFTFTTPTPRIVTTWPGDGPQPRDAPMFVAFDQQIDPAAVLETITVTAAGATHPTRLATAAEIGRHAALQRLIGDAVAAGPGDRWLAFVTTAPLPPDARVEISVGPGTPSREGPDRSPDAQRFGFRTYPPLAIARAGCRADPCPPGASFEIELSNPLDGDRVDADQVAVTPAGAQVEIDGRTITIAGAADTRYTAVLAGALVDAFGQTLGQDAALTWTTGGATPYFWGPEAMFVVDPAATRPTLDVFTRSYTAVKVQLYAVTPKDFGAYARHIEARWDRRPAPPVPGTKVFDRAVAVSGAGAAVTRTALDLAPALRDGRGHVIAVVEPAPWTSPGLPPRLEVWIQATGLAVDAAVDADELRAWVSRLSDGAPVAHAALTIEPTGVTGHSGADGTAVLKLAQRAARGPALLVARRGDDVAFVPAGRFAYDWSAAWIKRPQHDQLRWHVTDDRRVYRPGEDVHVKGWLRVAQGRTGGDLAGVAGQVSSVTYRALDDDDHELARGTAKVSALGGFDLAFAIPATARLGRAKVELAARGGLHGTETHEFQIEEFRRPEFEVSAHAADAIAVVGGSADVTVDARYFAGGGLPGAAVRWDVWAEETVFVPPNRDDFSFGRDTPWWVRGQRAWARHASLEPQDWTHAGTTDADGAHTLHLDLLGVEPVTPMSISATATVTDVNRQAWSASTSLLVHPASAYLGLRAARPYVAQGQPIEIEAIDVDLDGAARVGQPITLHATRLDSTRDHGDVVTIEADPQTCTLTSTAAASTCAFATPASGPYRITGTVTDERGRTNRTELIVWVAGGAATPADLDEEQVLLIPDATAYQPGDTAELLIRAPFYPAEGVLSVRRAGIVSSSRFTLTGPSRTLRVPIAESAAPSVHVQVDLIGAAARTAPAGQPGAALPPRPAYAVGTIDLPVPPTRRALAVTIHPRVAVAAPGAGTALEVTVADAAGRPVRGAEVAVLAVDEATLALTDARFEDPLDTFYRRRDADVTDHRLREFVRLMGAGDPFVAGDDRGLDSLPDEVTVVGDVDDDYTRNVPSGRTFGAVLGTAAGVPPKPITVRARLDPLAVFAPSVITDAAGRAVVPLTLPDNLTRYRLVALAVAGDRQFGKGESAITARLPLMVRPSAPRFLNVGDRFALPVVVQNQTAAALEVDVAVRATNATLTAGRGQRVTVPAHDRVELRFPVAVARPGTARFQIAATARAGSDAAEVALPVWTPATTEAFATYGQLDDGAVRLPVALPGAVAPAHGGLEIETSSTQREALTDALAYLVAYRFECAEQISARVGAIAELRDVLTTFAGPGRPTAAQLEARVATDLARLYALQNADGGFGFWRRGDASWPFLAVHVTNALVRARRAGFTVAAAPLDQALAYLRTIERRFPASYGPDVRRAITSYALATRALAGDRDVVRARGVIADAGGVDALPIEAAGWLLAVLAQRPDAATERAALRRTLDNRVTETAAEAHFTTTYADGAYLALASDRRADAVVLDALLAEDRTSPLIPKLAAGLLGHTTAGRWASTQENAVVLGALDQYVRAFERVTPAFVARIWLGDGYAGDHAFQGRTTERFALAIPIAAVAARASAGSADLIIAKDGPGRLYYRVALAYAPASLQLAAVDRGFAVTRRYEPVDDPGDVVRKPDGTWAIKAGARVRVRLALVADGPRDHVALVDPLPAGLEPQNPALAATGPTPPDPDDDDGRWWRPTWFEHQDLRDDRAEAFTARLPAGVHAYTYVARATTPGTFVVPPTRAEQMYQPEVFGRTATDTVVVE